MGGAAWAGLIPQLPDFAGAGMNWAISQWSRRNYASQVRHLRRREYQDMMFSMKRAGLNPMLASGATPGHSAAIMQNVTGSAPNAGIGSAMAAHRVAGAKEKGTAAEVTLKGEQAQKVAAEKANAMLLGDQVVAQTRNLEANSAKANAEAQAALKNAGLIDANTAKAAAETDRIRRDITASTGGNVITDPAGYIGTAAKRLAGSAKEAWRWAQEEQDRIRMEADAWRQREQRRRASGK